MKIRNAVLRHSLCGLSVALLAQTANAVLPSDSLGAADAKPSIPARNSAIDSPRFIVKYSDNQLSASSFNTSSMVSSLSSKSGETFKYVREMATGAFVVQVKGDMTKAEIQNMVQTMEASSSVEYFEEDRRWHVLVEPSDPQYDDQWHYFEAAGGLNLPDAWDSTTGENVVVAVIDTGITDHVDLRNNLLPGYDMISDATIANDGNGRDSDPSDTGDATDPNECRPNTPARSSSWHGTHVAGTVAAVANNGRGVAGVAYNAKVVPIRALGRCGGFTSDIADGMIWAAGGSVPGVPGNPNPAQVLNLSLGGAGACDSTSQAAINQAVNLGATVVVAAGNSSENVSNATPANCNNVVSVAAVGRGGGRASYSNFGSLVDVAAPGGDQRAGGTTAGVLSTLNSGSTSPGSDIYQYYQGTSMAAPHVAGVAALLYSLNPNITPAAVESILETTARSFPASCSGCGTGIVDAAAAVETQLSGSGPSDSELDNGVAKTGLTGSLRSETFFTIDVPAGSSNLTFVTSGGSGDADLYVRFGARPTTTTYDCRPFRNGNSETCTIASPQAGTYHVMVRGYAAYSGLRLVANYEATSSRPDTLSQSGVSGAQNQFVDFEVDVPAGRTSLQVAISGGTGDADLYVRFGQNPTTTTYDCRPFRNGNSETCTINSPSAGTYFVRLRGYRAFSGVTLSASSQ